MGLFSNREIATGIILGVFVILVIAIRSTRKPLGDVIRILFQYRFILLFLVLLFYTEIIVYVLSLIGYWDFSMIKDTVIWFLISGLVISFNSISSKQNERYFYKILKENIQIVLILEFLINAQTFSLIAELILVFLFTLLAIMMAFTEIKEEYKSVNRIFERFTVLGGLVILFAVIRSFIINIKDFDAIETIKTFFLPIILTFSILPMAYLIMIFSRYETLFVRLKLGCEKSRSLTRYAKRRLIQYGMLSQTRINQLLSSYQSDLIQLSSKSEMKELFRKYKNHQP